MDKFGLPNKTKTDIIKWGYVGDALILADGTTQLNARAKHYLAEGYLLFVDPDFDEATEKIVGGWAITDTITNKVVDKTAAEIEAGTTSSLTKEIAVKRQEITEAYRGADQAIFSDYTPEQQKTFYKQEAEARAWSLGGDAAHTPFIDGMTTEGWRTKQELADRIILKADLLSAAYGALIEKYQHLIDTLSTVDPGGDPAEQRAILDLIIW